MNFLTRVWQSSLGKKYIMAVTGFVLVLFVIGHLIGNLQIFLPPEAINGYAHFLKSTPELLWGVRLGLVVMVILHVVSAVQMSLENQAARPTGYAGNPVPKAAGQASRTMLLGGITIGAFVIYHLLHYTVLVAAVNFEGIDFGALKDPKTGYADVYAMMIYGFSKWFVSLFYILALGVLGLHLSHGIQAMFQSMGWKNELFRPLLDKAAKVIAVALFLGYTSMPVAVLCGYGQAHLQAATQQALVGKTVAK